ncbi:nuclear transport factor 2 family protein [Sodalis sp. RH21]|uniref:nuclear transport factor 2 family protein n=1 Tax=unclassified Sodalis (in: enterobacteria) TaxID=2636512 RepID=UPI0039B4A0D5
MSEENRQFLTSLFQSIKNQGWGDNFMAVLHNDLEFNAMGTSAISGSYKGKEIYRDQLLKRLDDKLESWPVPIVDTMIVDGDLACLQFHATDGKGKNGADFNMQYCWVLRLENRQITKIWGYYDSYIMDALFKRV